MGKIGLLYLNDGKWNGQTIINPSWIQSTWQSRFTGMPGMKYGYLWWAGDFGNEQNSEEVFYASGYGQQYIICVPNRDLLCVIIGKDYSFGGQVNQRILDQYLLPAIK